MLPSSSLQTQSSDAQTQSSGFTASSRWYSNLTQFVEELSEEKQKELISGLVGIIADQHNFALVKELANSVTAEEFNNAVNQAHKSLVKKKKIDSRTK